MENQNTPNQFAHQANFDAIINNLKGIDVSTAKHILRIVLQQIDNYSTVVGVLDKPELIP